MALSRADIQRAFQNSLGRPASQADEDAYFAASQSSGLSDAQLYAAISNSQEANLNTDPVVRFYQTAFGRVPDKAGLDNATDYIRANGASAETYQKLADMFVQSPEFQARFPGTGVTAEYVQALYNTILGREASTAEINAYVTGANGYDTRGEVLYAISQSNEAIARTDPAVNAFLQDAAEGDASYAGTIVPPFEPEQPQQPETPGDGGGGGGSGGGGGGGGGGPVSSFAINDATPVSEGESAVFTITRSGDVSTAATVTYTTRSGSATSGSDFVAETGQVQFAAGVRTQTVDIATTIDPQNGEARETFRVELSNPSAGTVIADGSGTGTIIDVPQGQGPVRVFDANGNFFDDFDTLQDAVEASEAGYSIYADAGTFEGDVVVDKANLSIYGNNSSQGSGDGTDGASVVQGGFNFTDQADGARLDGFTITGTLDNSTTEFSTIFVQASDVTITNNNISPDADTEGTQGIVNTSDATDLAITDNVISGYFRAIYLNPISVDGEDGTSVTGNDFEGNDLSINYEIDGDGVSSAVTIADNSFSETDTASIRIAVRQADTIGDLDSIGVNEFSDTAIQVEVRAAGGSDITGSDLNDEMSAWSYTNFYEASTLGVTFDGGAGDDILHGSVITGPDEPAVVRADTLTGGTGTDTFDFVPQGISAATDAQATEIASVIDEVTDFTTGDDTLLFDITTISYEEDTAANYEDAFAQAQTAFVDGDINVYAAAVGDDVYVFTAENGPDRTGVVRLTGVNLSGISAEDINAGALINA